MQKTTEHTRANSRVSPEIELLIRERNKGETLRQLGKMFGRSHERIRQLLAEYDLPQLLPEERVVAKPGYPVTWLTRLRKEGIINPIRPGGFWLYSEEQVKQIPSLIAEVRKCEQCGKPRSLGSQRFCRECSQYRRKHLGALYIKAWRKANPEWKEMQRKARAKYFERTDYVVSHGNYLPLETIVRVKASHPSNPALAILGNGLEIPFSCLRKVRSGGQAQGNKAVWRVAGSARGN
ncbi:unnamed protein product [marine sediment metagenome]|uniref:Uncharacterized protein n=1 Tax=marine sediment metagenome TaxID=412755 RepID=X0SAH9_9ZZZZ